MARLFDDASIQYLNVASTPVSDYPLTMACLVNCDDISSDLIVMSVGDKDVSNHYHALMTNESGGTTYIASRAIAGGTPGTANSTSGISADTWHHACVVHTNSTSRAAFLDGGNKGTDATDRTPANLDATQISGRLDDAGAQPFSGAVAEAAIWNVALTDFEVWLQAKLRLSPLWIRPQNLVFYSALLNNEDYDIVGRRKLTAYNSPTVAAHPPGIIYPPQPFGWAGPKSPRNINLLSRGLM